MKVTDGVKVTDGFIEGRGAACLQQKLTLGCGLSPTHAQRCGAPAARAEPSSPREAYVQPGGRRPISGALRTMHFPGLLQSSPLSCS